MSTDLFDSGDFDQESDVPWGLYTALADVETPLEDQIALESLFDQGFSWEQVVRLVMLRDHVWDIPEMVERVTCDPHVGFVRWLYEHGVYQS